MTKKEALALELQCEKLLSETLCEEIEVALSFENRLNLSFAYDLISFCYKSKTPKWVRFMGDYSTLVDNINKITAVLKDNESLFDKLVWSYNNKDKLTDETYLFAKVIDIECGCKSESKEVSELFFLGQVVQVDRVDMGQSRTSIQLKGFKPSFNSVFFEFFEDSECAKPIDIFSDERYNPYLKIFKE